MNILLADSGGTNTRLALADASGLRGDTFARHPNANWNHFDEILESYLREHSAPRIETCWIAVAGDVNGRTAKAYWNLDASSTSAAPAASSSSTICAHGINPRLCHGRIEIIGSHSPECRESQGSGNETSPV